MQRTIQIAFIAVFAAIISGVPIVQVCLDRLEEEPPQFFELWTEWDPAQMSETNRSSSLSSLALHLRRFESDLEQHSYFEEILRPRFQALLYALLRQPGNKALIGKDDWFFYLPGLRYVVEPYYASHERLSPAGVDPLEVIKDFSNQLAQRDISLLVVVVPGKASIYPEQVTRIASQPEQAYGNSQRFVRELSAMGVSVLPLHKTLLKNKKESKHALFMRTDTHWSGTGVRIAAQAIAHQVKQQPWFGSHQQGLDRSPRYRRRVLEVKRSGDIPRMSQMSFQSILFDEEVVPCFQVLNHSNGLYQDDPESPILLIGDSFSRVFQTDEPTAAGLIANLAYELNLPLASIVNDGGASTLVRQQLARRIDLLKGKKLVIWEFIERDIRFGMQGWQPIELFSDE